MGNWREDLDPGIAALVSTAKRARYFVEKVDRDIERGSDDLFWKHNLELDIAARRFPRVVWPFAKKWLASPYKKVRKSVVAAGLHAQVLDHKWDYWADATAAAKANPFVAHGMLKGLDYLFYERDSPRLKDIAALKRRLKPLDTTPKAPPPSPLANALAPGNDSFMDELFAIVSEKKPRNAHAEAVFLVHVLDVQVPGDGLAGYFGNCDKKTVLSTPAALKRVGATKAAAWLGRALTIAGARWWPANMTGIRKALGRLDEGARAQLNSLERRYHSGPVQRSVRAYVKLHRRHFE